MTAPLPPTAVPAPLAADEQRAAAAAEPRPPSWARVVTWVRDDPWGGAALLLALVVGIGLRWWVMGTALGTPDLDEATVGIQATRFGEGELSAFFMNQPYGGTLETGIVAVVFQLFGSSVLALKAVPIALTLVAAVLTHRLAVALELSRTGQWAAPILLWCGPAFAILFSTKERGFYGVALVLAAAYPLLAVRIARRPTGESHHRDLLLLGLCIGLGWWQTPLTFAVALPACLWLVAVRPKVLGVALWAVPTALLGALPWFWWNVENGWASLEWGSTFGSTWFERFGDWAMRMEVVLGIETPFDDSRRLVALRGVGVALLVVIVVVATLRTRVVAPYFLATMVVGYGVLYAANGLAAGVGEDPRYTYLMLPILAVCIAAVLPDAPSGPLRFAAVVGVGALAVASTAWGLQGLREAAERPRPNPFLASPGIEEVTRLLERRAEEPGGTDAAITDIAGMQIAFLSDEAVVGASFGVPRELAYEVRGRAVEPSTYVLDRGLSVNVRVLRAWLAANDVGFQEYRIGKWQVFFLEERVLPGDVGLFVFGGRLRPAGG